MIARAFMRDPLLRRDVDRLTNPVGPLVDYESRYFAARFSGGLFNSTSACSQNSTSRPLGRLCCSQSSCARVLISSLARLAASRRSALASIPRRIPKALRCRLIGNAGGKPFCSFDLAL
jgi:hypothetical protein